MFPLNEWLKASRCSFSIFLQKLRFVVQLNTTMKHGSGVKLISITIIRSEAYKSISPHQRSYANRIRSVQSPHVMSWRLRQGSQLVAQIITLTLHGAANNLIYIRDGFMQKWTVQIIDIKISIYTISYITVLWLSENKKWWTDAAISKFLKRNCTSPSNNYCF